MGESRETGAHGITECPDPPGSTAIVIEAAGAREKVNTDETRRIATTTTRGSKKRGKMGTRRWFIGRMRQNKEKAKGKFGGGARLKKKGVEAGGRSESVYVLLGEWR